MGCCQTLSGIAASCGANTGGINRLYMACFDEAAGGFTITDNQVSAISTTAAATFKEFAMKEGVGSIAAPVTKNQQTGVLYYSNTAVTQFAGLTTDKRTEFMAMVEGDLSIIMQDNNGRWWLLGRLRAARLSEGTAQSGTAFDDLNGFDATFIAVEGEPFIEVTADAMEAILTPTVTP